MTAKPKKTKRQKVRSRRGEVLELRASVEDDLLSLAEEEESAEARWNRPRKRTISLRVDTEVIDWFKSKGPGYQTRINRILRRVMMGGKEADGGEIGGDFLGSRDVPQVSRRMCSRNFGERPVCPQFSVPTPAIRRLGRPPWSHQYIKKQSAVPSGDEARVIMAFTRR